MPILNHNSSTVRCRQELPLAQHRPGTQSKGRLRRGTALQGSPWMLRALSWPSAASQLMSKPVCSWTKWEFKAENYWQWLPGPSLSGAKSESSQWKDKYHPNREADDRGLATITACTLHLPPCQDPQVTSPRRTETRTRVVNKQCWDLNWSAYHGQARWPGKPTFPPFGSDMVTWTLSRARSRCQEPLQLLGQHHGFFQASS